MAPASSLCAARLEALSLCRRRGAPPPRPTAPRSVQGLTTCLYPLSVIKTRQMALEGAPPGLWVRRGAPLGGAQRHLLMLRRCGELTRAGRGPPQGAAQVARQVVATDGVRGLYRGFTTVVVGVIPARGVRPSGACARRASGRAPDGRPPPRRLRPQDLSSRPAGARRAPARDAPGQAPP